MLFEVACMSRFTSNPRAEHMQQVLNIFNYLKIHATSWIHFDHNKINIQWDNSLGMNPIKRAEILKEQYPDAEESIPTNAPIPRGKSVQINCFVDADHAGDKITRRSQTGILIFCNMAPIVWYSKKQNTVETSTFSTEFVALKTTVEILDGIRYKLRRFGVSIDGPSNVFCDNLSVVRNSSFPDSPLKKKHCSIAYHKVRESIAGGSVLLYYKSTKTNLADLFTKLLSVERRKILMCGMFG